MLPKVREFGRRRGHEIVDQGGLRVLGQHGGFEQRELVRMNAGFELGVAEEQDINRRVGLRLGYARQATGLGHTRLYQVQLA